MSISPRIPFGGGCVARLSRLIATLRYARKRQKPRCIVIAGPTAPARPRLPRLFTRNRWTHPLRQRRSHRRRYFTTASRTSGRHRGRLVLRELDRLVEAKADFAFESTLSGLRYAKRIHDWKAKGYSIEIAYLRSRLLNWR